MFWTYCGGRNVSNGSRSVRAFRPSYFGTSEPDEHDMVEFVARMVRIQTYAVRAQARLPLFEESAAAKDRSPSVGRSSGDHSD